MGLRNRRPAVTLIGGQASTTSPAEVIRRLEQLGILSAKQARKSLEALQATTKPVTLGRLVTQMAKVSKTQS